MKEIRERRSDPTFRDLPRYLADGQLVVKSLRQLAPNARVLDIGAGAGIFSLLLRRVGFNVTATNFVASIAAEMTFFGKFGVDFAPLDLDKEPIPFGNNYFDAVLLMDVIEHLRTRFACLRELWRVLRVGGLLILFTPNRIATVIPRFIRRMSLLLSERNRETHFKEYTMPKLVSRLESLGFAIKRSEYSNSMIAGFGDIPKTVRELLFFGYRLGCRLIPSLSYEINIVASKMSSKRSPRNSPNNNP